MKGARYVPIACSFAALTMSLLAVLAVTRHHVHLSFSLILFAVLFDMLDGSLSRRLQAESDIGAHVDLLQDSVNYLLYPCILYFKLGFDSFLATTVLCLFFGAGCWRLARFSVIGFSEKNGKWGYTGMPVFYSHVGVLGTLESVRFRVPENVTS